MTLPLGIPIDPRTGEPIEPEEREHYIRCECGAWIDCRDLAQVLAHHGRHERPAGSGDQ